MSATDELIQNVYEFRGLLRYLGENYPGIIKEWKNKGAELAVRTPQTTDDSNHQVSNLNGYRDK